MYSGSPRNDVKAFYSLCEDSDCGLLGGFKSILRDELTKEVKFAIRTGGLRWHCERS
jgi:hypothetical protein